MYFYSNLQENALFSGKNQSNGTNFTLPPVVAVVTDLNTVQQTKVHFVMVKFVLLSQVDAIIFFEIHNIVGLSNMIE